MKKKIKSWLLVSVLLLPGGCNSIVYKGAATTAEHMGSHLILPDLMKTEDTGIACSTGESLVAAITPLQIYDQDIKRLAVLAYMISGLCAYSRAVEFGLESARHYHVHQKEAAIDAAIQAKRWHIIAAKRNYLAYEAMMSVYPDFGKYCPGKLGEADQFIWLSGVSAVLQALLNDAMSGYRAEIPLGLAPIAARGVGCLNDPRINRRWWGLPQAYQAVIWMTIPGSAPPGSSPRDMLLEAVDIGNQRGIRMASALLAVSLADTGQIEDLKQFLKRYGNLSPGFHVDPDWGLIDAFAQEFVLVVSDQLWMEATGHRTPVGRLGGFWDSPDVGVGVSIEVEDL